MNVGYSPSLPRTYTLGEMLSKFRLIEVENRAIDADALNITATHFPVRSHTMLFGNPPISRLPV